MSERVIKIILILFVLLVLTILVIPFTAGAQTVVKRSIRPTNTSVIHDLSTNAITISGSTLTATNPFPDSIGVGDAVQYDSSNSGAVTSIAFLHSRTSSTVWTVKRASGAAPSPCTSDTDGDVFGAYTSLANHSTETENTGISATVRNFDAGSQDLISATRNHHAVCYPGTDATTATMNSWISNGTYKLEIYTPYLTSDVGTTQRHAGKFTGRCYFLSTSDGTGSMKLTGVSGNAYNFTMTGLQIKNTVGDGFHDGSGNAAAATNLRFESCIFIGSNNSSTSASHSGIDQSSTQVGSVIAINCVFYQWAATPASNNNAAIHLNSSGGTSYVYNCTSFGGDRGFVRISGTAISKNSICGGVVTSWQGTWDAASVDNLDSRSLAPGTGSTQATVTAWVDSAAFDFHLKSTDTAAKDQGTDLSGDASAPFTNDIDGGTRPDITLWDRGPDEQGVAYGVSGGTSSVLKRRRNPVQ